MMKRGFITRSAAILLGITLGLGALPARIFNTEAVKAAEVTGATGSAAGETVGDINGDGEINAKDVTMLRRHLAGGWNVAVNEEDADINGDGEVNAKDVTMLRRFLAGGWGVTLKEKEDNYEIESKNIIVKTVVKHHNEWNRDRIADRDTGFSIEMYGADGLLYNKVYIDYDASYNPVIDTWQYEYEGGKRIKGVCKEFDGSVINIDYEYKDDQIIEKYTWKDNPKKERTLTYNNDWLLLEDEYKLYESVDPNDWDYMEYSHMSHYYEYNIEDGVLLKKSDCGSSGYSRVGSAGFEDYIFYDYNSDGSLSSEGTIISKDEDEYIDLAFADRIYKESYWTEYLPYINYYYDDQGRLSRAEANYPYSKKLMHLDDMGDYTWVRAIDPWIIEFIRNDNGIIESIKWSDTNGRITSFKILYDKGVLSGVTYDIEVPVNENTFPDVYFRKYVSNSFDIDHNGILNKKELENVTVIDCRPHSYVDEIVFADPDDWEDFLLMHNQEWEYWNAGNGIQSLKGLEQFTELKELDCGCNQLRELCIENNKKLETLDCRYNFIEALDISNNPDIMSIYCMDNRLVQLTGDDNSHLWYLNCSFNKLDDRFDIDDYDNLEELVCEGNEITSISWWNSNLKRLSLSFSPLKDIDLWYLSGLEYLYINNCLDLSEINNLDCCENLYFLQVSQCPNIHEIDVSSNSMLMDENIYVNDNVSIIR